MGKTLRVAYILFPSFSYEGEGMAMVVYFQGCHNRCVGCHNVVLQSFEGGDQYTPIELKNKIDNMFLEHNESIDSIVLSGGEPLHQDMYAMINFLTFIKMDRDVPIWLYTSFPIGMIPEEILRRVDVVVDGPFQQEYADRNLKYRGSENQRIYRKKYVNDIPRWEEANDLYL